MAVLARGFPARNTRNEKTRLLCQGFAEQAPVLLVRKAAILQTQELIREQVEQNLTDYFAQNPNLSGIKS